VIQGIALAGLAALAFVALIHLSNHRLLDRRYPVSPSTFTASQGAEAIARGKRLADITGCTDCHGPDLRGQLFADEGWWRGRYYASNLTLKALTYSDADLARIVREGVRPDGRGVIAMPSFAYVRLTDAETADLIAFIRSVPAAGVAQPAHWIGPRGQWDWWTGTHYRPAVLDVEPQRRLEPPELGPHHAEGRHLAGVVCAEYHGGDLKGNGWDTGAPDLGVAAAYTRDQLARLLRSGVAADGRERGLMTLVSKSRLHHLSDDDIGRIHDYLSARARSRP
jgi:mono/diheme cytochrome c family protein